MKATRSYTMTARADGAAATRERIVHAALQLFFDQWYEDVTLAAIAKAAGVSHQTVLNHFDSKEGVALAALQIAERETIERRAFAAPGDIDGAVHVLVGEYERFGDSNARWAASSERLGSLAGMLDVARASHQEWLEQIFDTDLPKEPDARRRAINALHAATDVYTWKLLRRDLHLGRAETEQTMAELVRGVLDRLLRRRASSATRTRTRRETR
jgi:AcrR family transcriptional regulator